MRNEKAAQKAVIDASNMLHLEPPGHRKANIKCIYAVIDAVKASGREPLVVVDPASFSALGDPEDLQHLLGESCVITVPPGSDGTRAVLETAQERDAIVVSNNIYADYWSEYPWIGLCRLPVAVVDGVVYLLEERFKKVS